jgi:hypothetical protein
MPDRSTFGVRPVAIGALAGAAGAALGSSLSPARRLDLGALELAFVAGAYPAMALYQGSRRAGAVECAVGGAFVGLAAGGLDRRSRIAIAVGLLGHAGWDAVHHLTDLGTRAPSWFPPFCMVADVMLAAQFLRSG